MNDFLSKFKIPTLLGLGVIISGIVVGTFLSLKEQNITSKASANMEPQNITLANLSDDSVAISWQTSAPVLSFITFGLQNPNETTVLDDRDRQSPKARLLHYVTIKNLLPKTTYQYKIISGKISSDVLGFTTAAPLNFQSGVRPIIGTALDGDKPLDEAIVYLSISDATTQSSLIKTEGNFLIPVSQIRKSDLSEGFTPTEKSAAKLTVVSPNGEATALFRLGDFERGLPAIKLGDNLDLTATQQSLDKYDLNGDGKVNSTDNAIILQNLGPISNKPGKNPKADLNGDGVVDQKDLDILIKKIKEQS